MSTRYRDHPRGFARDYYGGPDAHDAYDVPRGYASQSPPRPSRYEDPQPRRGKSERRRPRSPEIVDARHDKPSRRHSRREPRNQPPPLVSHGGRRAAPESMDPADPIYAPEPPRHDRPSRRDRERHRDKGLDRDRDGEYKTRRPDRNSMPPLRGDPYDRMGPLAAVDAREDRLARDYRGDAEARPRRHARESPPLEPRLRDRDPHEPRPTRRRERYPSPAADDRYGALPRRPRSQVRPPRAEDISPPRGRPPPAQAGRPRGAKPRRSSMPASSSRAAGAGMAGTPWWQNKAVQARARTALTAGAQAAFRSRDERGEWLGAKGAKVATAALSAALVDGFLGGKSSDAPHGSDKGGRRP